MEKFDFVVAGWLFEQGPLDALQRRQEVVGQVQAVAQTHRTDVIEASELKFDIYLISILLFNSSNSDF